MDRRDFLKTVAIAGAAMTIQRSEAMEVLTQAVNNTGKPDLVAVMGGEPEVMFQRAIAELGGMKQFVKPGQKVVLVDDLVATGGTIEAAIKLVEELGGEVVKVVFLMELAGLKGRERLKGYEVESVLCYDGK